MYIYMYMYIYIYIHIKILTNFRNVPTGPRTVHHCHTMRIYTHMYIYIHTDTHIHEHRDLNMCVDIYTDIC